MKLCAKKLRQVKNLKLFIFCGAFFSFYLYIVIFSSRIDYFLSRSYQDLYDSHNRSKVMSPFEGPVDDLLGGRIQLKIDPRKNPTRDPGVAESERRKGRRVLPGFHNPLIDRLSNRTEEQNEFADFREVRPVAIVDELNEQFGRRFNKPEPDEGRPYQNGDCCIEVKKKKLYLDVHYPPFISFGKPGDPGENGEAVRFRFNELSKQDAAKKEEDFNIHYFDEWASRKVALHRYLKDDRPDECRIKYSSLPAASVVIVFHNEAWTTLLRSIHSILDRTPGHLLQEIVLLDDYSDMDHLKDPLESYLQPLTKVKLLRSKRRLGLIRARNIAFDHSKGKIVIFLDSHIECFPGWIEPLLAPIHNDSTVITFPSIEMIGSKTFATGMNNNPNRAVGGLMLNSLSFNWLYDRRYTGPTPVFYYKSPTMPGGLYAVSRQWFSKLGKYDPDLDFWGGENIEISFKTWMCGGSLLLSLCSHVGHIFRNFNPNLHNVHLTYKNSIRVAEVWMDHYKHFFYEKLGYNLAEYGDVTSRVQLRKSLNCSSFGWYLNTVFPELKKKMDIYSVYYGEIRSVSENVCLTRKDNKFAGVDSCRLGAVTQQWQLGSDKRITSGEFILGAREEIKKGVKTVDLSLFHEKAFDKTVDVSWIYDNKRILNVRTGYCLQVNTRIRGAELKPCALSSQDQKWNFTTRIENQELMKKKGIKIDWNV